MASSLHAIATALMVPGNRPDRFDKARQRCGHAMIIDLEDAVPHEGKAAARAHVTGYLAAGPTRDGPLVGVRINALTDPNALDDLMTLRGTIDALDLIAVPMVESGRDVQIARAALGDRDLPLMAIVETIAGLDNARSIAAALGGRGAIGFGAADYSAEAGMAMTRDALLAARIRLVEAGAQGGVPCFDVPYLQIGDDEGLAEEAAYVRDLGFAGKLAIHPSQVQPIIEAFQPSAEAVAQAERIIEAFEQAGRVAIQVDGRMIDKPVYDQAVAIRARSGQA
ncbi:MAG: CoA ester lyase [Pseudomonadota bacterium]